MKMALKGGVDVLTKVSEACEKLLREKGGFVIKGDDGYRLKGSSPGWAAKSTVHSLTTHFGAQRW